MFSSVEIANFKAFDSHIALVVNVDNAASAGGREVRCIQYRRLSWKASKGDVAITRVSGCGDGH